MIEFLVLIVQLILIGLFLLFVLVFVINGVGIMCIFIIVGLILEIIFDFNYCVLGIIVV